MLTVSEEVGGLPPGLKVGVVDERRGFPLLIAREEGTGSPALFEEVWEGYRGVLDSALQRRGALLFRGFGFDERPDFESLVEHFRERKLDYVDGNSPRTKLGRNVYTSTEYPPEFFISLHNELSYAADWPARLFFCCVGEPDEGGETPLVDGRELLRELPAPLVEEFRRRRVKYVRNLHGGRGFGPSWQKTFETEERADVEAYARSSATELQWLPDGTARLTCVRPATTVHPETGEEVWFNQADQFHPSTHPAPIYQSMMAFYKGREDRLPQNATFGDDTPIPVEYLETIRERTRHLLALFNWRRGDLLMVDNVLTAHGRMPYKGARKILVAMTAR
jgi:alpha-ketoglutarate-dependent taurine dioxygenase